jgi:hypothetical protein
VGQHIARWKRGTSSITPPFYDTVPSRLAAYQGKPCSAFCPHLAGPPTPHGENAEQGFLFGNHAKNLSYLRCIICARPSMAKILPAKVLSQFARQKTDDAEISAISARFNKQNQNRSRLCPVWVQRTPSRTRFQSCTRREIIWRFARPKSCLAQTIS